MPSRLSREAGGHLRTLFTLGVSASLSDAQLIDRFVLQRDEMAFAALVERHGPMVFGVCRRVLRDRHEAEDAFQATFLILARKAATLARRERLANWLYGVAFRTAKDARGRACRRQSHEREVMARGANGPSEEATHHEDLRAVLDEELARLPDRLRVAVVLCELEGHSRSEAARRLGIPEGTLSSRLARAKDLLRERLTNRGLALFAAGVFALGLTNGVEAGFVPVVLIESTVQAAARVAAGSAVVGVVSTSVSSLTEGVLKTMFLAKLKGIALGTLALGAVTAGAVLAQNPGTDSSPSPFATSDDRAPSAGPESKPKPTRTPAKVHTDLILVSPAAVPAESPAAPAVDRMAALAPAVDRMAALESKLDRILNALEQKTRAANPLGSRLVLVNPNSNPTPVANADPNRLEGDKAVNFIVEQPTARNRPEPRLEAPVASPVPAQRPRAVATRPAVSVSQRLDDIEKRLERLEKQLGGALPGTTAEASLDLPPSVYSFVRPVGLDR